MQKRKRPNVLIKLSFIIRAACIKLMLWAQRNKKIVGGIGVLLACYYVYASIWIAFVPPWVTAIVLVTTSIELCIYDRVTYVKINEYLLYNRRKGTIHMSLEFSTADLKENLGNDRANVLFTKFVEGIEQLPNIVNDRNSVTISTHRDMYKVMINTYSEEKIKELFDVAEKKRSVELSRYLIKDWKDLMRDGAYYYLTQKVQKYKITMNLDAIVQMKDYRNRELSILKSKEEVASELDKEV